MENFFKDEVSNERLIIEWEICHCLFNQSQELNNLEQLIGPK